MEQLMKKILLILISGLISACATTPNPDGSTTVKLSIPGLSQPKPSQPAPQEVRAESTQKASALPQMAGTPISQTALSDLFQKFPWTGANGPYYPKVAITITDWSRSDCWSADANIWSSAKKFETVKNFYVCMNKSLGAAVNGAAGLHLFFEQTQTSNSTGNVRTAGPNPPMLAYLDNAPNAQLHTSFVQQLVQETAWKPIPGQITMWVVAFKNQ